MKFSDFNADELINKLVLFMSGSSFMGTSSKISIITHVTKTGFRIKDSDGLFSLNTGDRKGLNGKFDMGTISSCALITEEQAQQYRDQWATNKEKKRIIEFIKDNYTTLSLEKLLQIEKIITK